MEAEGRTERDAERHAVPGDGAEVLPGHRVLLIDDDEPFCTEAKAALEMYEFAVELAHDWEAGLIALERINPALILLDQRLGRVDALARLSILRRRTDATIVVLTGNQSEADRIIGLEAGADDFLVKPISLRELASRVRAHLRRGSAPPAEAPRWRVMAQARRVVSPSGEAVPLTGTEFELLLALMEHGGEPVTRDQLSRRVLGRAYNVEDRALDNLVYQLRTKIRASGGGDVVVALRNRGYVFTGLGPREG